MFLFPKGAGVGMLTAFVLMMWLGLSAQIAKSSGAVHNNQIKSFSIENCPVYNESFFLPEILNWGNSSITDKYSIGMHFLYLFTFGNQLFYSGKKRHLLY